MPRTLIRCQRKDLHELCKLGIMAVSIGVKECTVYIPTERLQLITVDYTVVEKIPG